MTDEQLRIRLTQNPELISTEYDLTEAEKQSILSGDELAIESLITTELASTDQQSEKEMYVASEKEMYVASDNETAKSETQ